MIGWIQTIFGFHQGDAESPSYLFFSGPAIVISVFWHGFVTGWTRYRAANCHVKHCWRIGRADTAAGHRVCWRHHPAEAPTADQVTAAHAGALVAAAMANVHDE